MWSSLPSSAPYSSFQIPPFLTHLFPLSTSFHSVWSPHRRFPRWPPAPGSRRPCSSWQMGDPGQGGRPDSVLPRTPPPRSGWLDHKARAAAAEPSSQRPSDGCALPCSPPAPLTARGQLTAPYPGRATQRLSLSPVQPSGSRRVTMLAPRAAAFLLLHLVLQPWQRAGAQATPQGKWPPLVPSAPSPLSLSRDHLEGPLAALPGFLGPHHAPLCSSGTRMEGSTTLLKVMMKV